MNRRTFFASLVGGAVAAVSKSEEPVALEATAGAIRFPNEAAFRGIDWSGTAEMSVRRQCDSAFAWVTRETELELRSDRPLELV